MHKGTRSFSLFLGLAVCLLVGAHSARAQELTREAKIERILDLMNAQATLDQMLDQFTAVINNQLKTQAPNANAEQLAQMQEFQKQVMELVKSRVSWAKLRPEFIRIYGETYSDEELSGMLSFFESPAGRGFLQKTPVITQKAMAVSQAQLGDLMPEIQRLAKEAGQKKP